ncbi:MAG: PadR family transcriptional regulator [Erysipelotrichaceae bacterium]|nr:PadR family transcriptional regulator [Erysipelotrichaceae bacterium]
MNSKTHIVILGLLSEEPLSGYDIKKLIDIRFRFFWSESYGQIYPTLKKMVNEGLVKALSQTKDNRGKQRYEITSLGRKTLTLWQAQEPEKESLRLELFLKMYFSLGSNPHILINYIKSFQSSHTQDLMILNSFKKELSSIPDPYQNHQNILSVIEFGVKTNTAYLQWCQETLSQLEGSHESR